MNHSVTAVLSLEKDCLFWPDAAEWKEISGHIRHKYKFPHCIGYVDGIHLGLAFKPELRREQYWTRRQQYVVSVLVLADDLKQIRHLQVGWPGSVHDNRIWKTLLYANSGKTTSAARNTILGTWHSTKVP